MDPDDEASRASLKAMSEWRMRVREPDYRWQPEGGSKQTINFNEIQDDDRNTATDPAFADAEALRRKLEAIFSELDADDETEAPEATGDPDADGLAGAEGTAAEAGRGDAGEAVAAVGEAGAASA
jgi:hypothetical protein